MSLTLNEQELAMTKNVIERLADMECLKLILDTNFVTADHEHKDELNSYLREYTLHNILAPICYMFFSNRMAYYHDADNTEKDLEHFIRGWLTEPNSSWGIHKLLTKPRPPIKMSWSINGNVTRKKGKELKDSTRTKRTQKVHTKKAKR